MQTVFLRKLRYFKAKYYSLGRVSDKNTHICAYLGGNYLTKIHHNCNILHFHLCLLKGKLRHIKKFKNVFEHKWIWPGLL